MEKFFGRSRGKHAPDRHRVFRKQKESRKARVWFALLSAFVIAVVMGISLFQLFQIKPDIHPGCAYSRYVHKISVNSYLPVEDTDNYRYWIDYADYIRDEAGNVGDYYGLISISGWEVVERDGTWGTNLEGVLLESDEFAYRVDTEMRKKTDIPYLDQSDPEDESLNVAFFTYAPPYTLSPGVYRIGLLVREEEQQKTLWTESRIEVR